MHRVLRAGAAYFAIVFLIGFALGVVRVFVVEPRLGSTFSVAAETPVMLLASWFAARWAVRRFGITGFRDLFQTGLFALVLLLLAEGMLGVALGQSVTQQLVGYMSGRGVLTLIGQGGFAIIPLLQGLARGSILQ